MQYCFIQSGLEKKKLIEKKPTSQTKYKYINRSLGGGGVTVSVYLWADV